MMPFLFTDLGPLVRFAKLRADRDVYDGIVGPRTARIINQCRHLYSINPEVSARLIYTRDIGHHSSGWFKNPDYERCLHLSISFCVNPTDAPVPFDKKTGQKIAEAFFEYETRKLWIEPPYSPEGKRADVHHYRLFCDERWNPIIPRGEVYDKTLTEVGWKSFSEIHGADAFKDADALTAALRNTGD